MGIDFGLFFDEAQPSLYVQRRRGDCTSSQAETKSMLTVRLMIYCLTSRRVKQTEYACSSAAFDFSNATKLNYLY